MSCCFLLQSTLPKWQQCEHFSVNPRGKFSCTILRDVWNHLETLKSINSFVEIATQQLAPETPYPNPSSLHNSCPRLTQGMSHYSWWYIASCFRVNFKFSWNSRCMVIQTSQTVERRDSTGAVVWQATEHKSLATFLLQQKCQRILMMFR